jgi:hypothetical protein
MPRRSRRSQRNSDVNPTKEPSNEEHVALHSSSDINTTLHSAVDGQDQTIGPVQNKQRGMSN